VKTPAALGLALVAVLATVAIEETRLSSLRSRLEAVETASDKAPVSTDAEARATAAKDDAPLASKSARVRERSDAKPSEAEEEVDSGPGDFAKAARKMWDTPAGKSMMNQGVKVAVAMMYSDYVESLDLTKEEKDYFQNLLGQEMADQQELGMKLLSATPEEQTKLMEEMEKRKKDNEEAIKTFLNDEEDYKAFETYKDRLPERQQLDGIRGALAAKQVPLDTATEDKLMDAMYRARTQPGLTDFNGPRGLEEMVNGNAVERFEEDWTRQQETLRKEVGGLLNESQMKAFAEYQEQMKEFQLMGLKMGQEMMSGKKDALKK